MTHGNSNLHLKINLFLYTHSVNRLLLLNSVKPLLVNDLLGINHCTGVGVDHI